MPPANGKPTIISCCKCSKSATTRENKAGQPGIPVGGWKRLGDNAYCADCWEAGFVCRCQTLPITSVLAPSTHSEGWNKLREALQTSWRLTTRAANWFLAQYYAADPAPFGKSPSRWPQFCFPNVDAQARELFPALDSQSLYDVREMAKKRYKADRLDMRRDFNVNLSTYRYPTPLPLPASTVTLEVNEQHQPFLECRISGTRFCLRLRNGYRYRRQISVLERIGAGECLLGGLKIRQGRDDILVHLSVYMPRQTLANLDGEMFLVTGRDRIVAAGLDERANLWILNNDELFRRIAHHAIRLERLRQDLKFERRSGNQINDRLLRELQVVCNKQNRYLDNQLHQSTAMLANLARRNRVGLVHYHDLGPITNPRFPWFKHYSLFHEKVAEFGATVELSRYCNEEQAERCLIGTEEVTGQ